MNIVAIESSGLVASVALASDDRIIAEYTMNNKQTHSQILLPMLEEIVRASGLEKSEIDAIAISRGPGSFTGLRIGSATAKGLGLAWDKPLVEVPTLEALAYNLYGTGDALICPIMDARRGEVYGAVYESCPQTGRALNCLAAEAALPLADLLEQLNAWGRRVIFTGDAVPVYKDMIAEQLQVPYSLAPAHLARQRAGAVAVLGLEYYRAGLTVSAADHAPVYLRVSQAEREKDSSSK